MDKTSSSSASSLSLQNLGKRTFREYTESTAVHGVCYLGERNRSIWERIFWILIMITSMYICGTYIQRILTKWNDTPVIITFSEKSTPVWKFPMPTITICPDAKFSNNTFVFSDVLDEVAAYFTNHTTDEPDIFTDPYKFSLFEVTSSVCDLNVSKHIAFGNKFFNESYFEILDDNKNGTGFDIFDNCWLSSIEVDCRDKFDKILTEKGLCYVFNLPSPSAYIFREYVLYNEIISETQPGFRNTKWTLDKGYEEDAVNETFPHRLYSPFVEDGMLLELFDLISDIDLKCSAGSEGYKISFNAPGEIPQISRNYINVPFNHETLIELSPELIATKKNAINYSPKIRKCYLENERQLYFFKIYTRNNCELECLTNHTYKQCGCVLFYMPRTKEMPVCGRGSIKCYERAKIEVISRDFDRLHSSNPEKILNCDCFPSCRSLTYSTSTTQAKLLKELRNNVSKMAEVNIYFKERRFWTSERTKLYGTIEFIAHAGGLVGLFMGISAISFVEIFYFCCIRFGQNLKNNKKEN